MTCFGELPDKSKQLTELEEVQKYTFGLKPNTYTHPVHGLVTSRQVFFITSPEGQVSTKVEDEKYNVQTPGDAPNQEKITEFTKKYLELAPEGRRHPSHYIGSYFRANKLYPNTVKTLMVEFETNIVKTEEVK